MVDRSYRPEAAGSAGKMRLTLAISAVLLSNSLPAAPPPGQLPIVCVAGSCGVGVTGWLGAGNATATAVGNTLTIQQASEQAILNWASFNVGPGGKVIFNQPNGSAIALNQIFQANPSQIFGLVKANGQIYLINQNGIVFGSSAQVNVGGLLASTLQLTNPLSAGLLSAIQNDMPALSNPLLGTDGAPIAAQISVQPGAQLATTGSGGRIMLAGQAVTNGGSISASDGQVILAAGDSVFIQASNSPDLRGLIVEVDSGGLAQNLAQGNISVNEGNVTMVGLAVNQQGRVSATTSVSENGSIELLARDTVSIQTSQTGVLELVPSHGGTLTLGATSNTSVLPDTASTATAVDSQAQPQSQITLAGEQVELMGGSDVVAPGGQVSITASSNPGASNSSLSPDPNAQLRIDSGAVINVAGEVATVPVTRNLIAVQLRGTELADDPQQRNGPLRGDTVIVDATVGTPFANISGELALVQRGVLERTDSGGTITLDSAGDVVVGSKATLNVSGGAVHYTPGIMQTSLLEEPDGATVSIANASPDQTYIGVVNPSYELVSNNFGIIQFIPTPGIAAYNPGYVQGASAGSIQVLGSSLVLNGNFLGSAVNGIYQRSGSGVASGGTFSIGLLTPSNPSAPDFRAPAVELVNQAPTVIVASGAPLPSDLPVELSTSLLTTGGFTHLDIASNDRIVVPAGVALDVAPGGSVTLQAPEIEIDSSIIAPSGSVQVTSTPSFSTVFGTPGLGISVGNGVTFNTNGSWINDSLFPSSSTPTGLALVNGGSVQLDQEVLQGTLSLGSGVALLADGGAQLQRGGSITGGTGGSIAIIGSPGGTVQVGDQDVVQGFGVQGARGGSFSLEAPRIEISSGDSTWLRAQSVDSDPNSNSFFKVDASLFADYGFASFKLTADGPQEAQGTTTDILTVDPGTTIDLSVRTLLLDSTYGQAPSGSALSGFSSASLLPAYQRTGEQLTLQAASGGSITSNEIGDLTIGAGATITADPGSSFLFASEGNLNFDGALQSLSSTVTLQNLAPAPGLVPPSPQIELASTANIDVAGTVVYQQNNTGLLQGSVLPGGSVSIIGTGSVVADVGSVINFSGTQAPLDLPTGIGGTQIQQQMVASAAGSLTIQAPQSISLLGNYQGQAGVGTTGRAAGGTLDIALLAIPGDPAEVIVQPGPLTEELSPQSGTAIISTSQLRSAGIDDLTLASSDQVQFTNGAQLDLARSLTITAPVIAVESQAAVNVTAPYIALGTASSGETAQLASPGTGTITFSGGEVDLIGALSFQLVGHANIVSSGEILLRGELLDTDNLGSLQIAGDLTLSAARVVPTTEVNYTITASGGASNTVQFEQNGSLSGVPLSVGGSLTVNADNIIQGGTVFAPFGQLTFAANDNLTFAPGSLTSVSGTSSILPYGEVQNGTSWVYQVSPSELVPANVTSIPNRQVSVSGAKVTLASGATIDVSGGGNLDAYEFTSGTGGTVDVLANNTTPGLYAVLPSLLGQTAPYDPMMWAGSNIAPNESVYLSGGGGLAAGVYPLLPARYALLPGAFLISVASGYQDLTPGTTFLASNSFPIVSGHFTNGGTGIGDTRTSGFLIEPGSYANQLADYTSTLASTFFPPGAGTTTQPTVGVSPLPADAGTLIVSVQSGFDALGKVNGGAASGGEGATVEISAPAIVIDPSVSAAGSAVLGQVHLASGVLDGWDAGRLWIGAQTGANGSVEVTASSVSVTAGSVLSAEEVALAATGNVQVDAGASIVTTSASLATATPLSATASPTTLALTGASAGSAVLIASDLNAWQVSRTGIAGSGGTLTLSQGAQVGSRGAVTIDAPDGGTLGDGALSGSGAQLAIGSTTLAFAPQGTVAGGFALDGSLVAALGKAGTVTFSAENAIDIEQPVNLGGAAGDAITAIKVVAPGLVNTAGDAASSFAAGLITLTGIGGTTSAVTQPGSGMLGLTGREIDIGPGTLGLSGFASSTLDASNVIVGTGGGALVANGNLNLLTPVLTAASDSQAQITATGNLTLAASPHPSVGTAPVLQTGGSLALSGNSVADSTHIVMPSGEVSITAAQQLTLGNGAGINVAGVLPVNAPYGSEGGSIALNSGGNLSAASAVTLSVAAAEGANAGSIMVTAGGSADIQAQLDGASAAGMRSGSFALQAGSLSNFSALNETLEQSGFHQTRAIEVGSGDLDLAAGSSITAQNVVLTADNGAVMIAGIINASGTGGGGSIALSARNGLSLASTGQLQANGLSGSAGGTIELASTAGEVQLDPAAQIGAAGSNNSGTLLVRAPQSAGGTDVNIASLPADLTHVGTVVLEPMLEKAVGSTPTSAQFQSIESAVAGYMAAASPPILSRLGVANTPNVVLRPYVDMTSSGDLTLASMDFSTWRFDGQPADIAIRAAGNLTVTGTISDGFSTNSSGVLDVQQSGDSARISLVAGANFGSASATAVLSGQAADLDLDAGAIVRTGTGALQLTAAQDIVFGTGASVYTGGIQGAASIARTNTGVPLSFPTDGGNIVITAGGNVTGAPVTEAVDQWNPRFQQHSGDAATWGVDFGQFQWNVGALGGGNVTINAGGSVIELTAAVADSRTLTNGSTPLALGGGNLTVNAAGDIGSGLFYVGNGVGRINAGGGLTSPLEGAEGLPLGTMLLAGDASYYVSAQRDVVLDGMVSETALAPGSNSDFVLFFRYGPDSTLSVQSRGGSITYQSNSSNEQTYLDVDGAFNTDPGVFSSGPSSLQLASFASDVVFLSPLQLQPSSTGQLSIYAGHDIQGNGNAIGMSDQPVSQVASPDAPSNLTFISLPFGGTSYTDASLHQNDPQPVQISAGQDIDDVTFDLAKFADVSAGGNITSLAFAGQNLNPNQITTIRAGGNISYLSTDTSQSLTLSGPGQFDIIAGGNVDLGLTSGIATYGNVLNPNLASSVGASVTVLAGLGAPIGVGGGTSSTDFVGKIVGASSAYQSMLTDYVEGVTGESNLTFAASAPIFRGLSLPEQLPLIEQIFFSELVLSGEEANEAPSLGFTRGYNAIDSLFPTSRGTTSPYSGDISLGFSRIYTLDGGSINLLAPGGGINVGLANPPSSFTEYNIVRTPSQLGIVAVGSGDVNIYTYDSILVNQSRVFTLGGGDINIWSTIGNIDAGNGAKTSISAPPPTIEVDANGNVTLDFSQAVAGSGIRTIQSLPDVAAGDVNLIAPVGFVNAGDAGIGSAGNINIAAQKVIGATNINFGGTATGVPPEVSGIGAALSGASSAANSATTASSGSVENSAAQSSSGAPLAAAALGWLDVFVEGFGEEVCKADDIECLKRNHETP